MNGSMNSTYGRKIIVNVKGTKSIISRPPSLLPLCFSFDNFKKSGGGSDFALHPFLHPVISSCFMINHCQI